MRYSFAKRKLNRLLNSNLEFFRKNVAANKNEMVKILRIIKRKVRNTIERCLSLNEEDIIARIENAEIVSFDIFDTLVKRDVEEPEYVHFLVGQKFTEETGKAFEKYVQCRERAEFAARKKAMGSEITISEIFDQIQDIPSMDKKLLIQLEQDLEYKICYQNLDMKRVYDIAYSMGKHIVITSDMYLPEDLINHILEKCGYRGYEKIYLSSSYGVTKSSGELFKYLRKDYNETNSRILHIGDNVKSDFYRAKQNRIKSILNMKRKKVYFYKKMEMRTWEEKCFYTFLSNHKLFGDNLDKAKESRSVFAKTVGYEVVGPILWGYIQWMQEQLKADGVEKIFFLSREGDLLQKAYKIIFPDSKIAQKYLYVSRQALQVPMLSECHNYQEMIQTMKPMMHSHTLDNIGRECVFDERYWEGCRELNLDTRSSVFDISPKKQEAYYDLVYQLGKNRFEEQRDIIRAYLKQEGFEGKIAVADIGWQGTMQKALLRYCDTQDIIGYYLGVRNVRSEKYYEGIRRKGFLFEPEKNEEWNLKMRFTTEIMETLFLNSEGSVTGYCRGKSKIEPCLGNNEYEYNSAMFLQEIQTAALLFLEEWKECVLSDYELTNKTIMKGYEHFAVRPTLLTVNYFKNLYFVDGGTKKLLPSRSLIYYIYHPRKLLEDMNHSACKIFALKEVFKLPFPYYRLLKFFLCRMKIKSPYIKNMEQ